MSKDDAYLDFAKKLALQAGKMMRQGQADCLVQTKHNNSPVTEVDQHINQMVINEVRRAYPNHGVMGEEASYHADVSQLWVCDPIDGTAAFIIGIPMSAFSLAFVEEGEPLVAVIYNPWTNEMYTAIKGQGAWRDTTRLAVSPAGQDPAERILIAARGVDASSGILGSQEAQKLLRQKTQWHLVHCFGIAYRGCLIARGTMHGTLYNFDGAHDIAALQLIITEAGGKVTDLDGHAQRYDRPINGAILSNGLIHEELITIVAHLHQFVEREP